MNLLLDEVNVLETVGDPSSVDVSGVVHDSRRVAVGDLFCCLPGTTADGHEFAADAVARGAVALLEEHVLPGVGDVLQVRVAEARPAMARVAAAFYGHPAEDLVMVGVTGTNGKTTVTHLLGAVLEAAGHPTTVLGTLSGARTTPESTELQALLAEVRDRAGGGLRPAVAMEVSSHALVQARVDGIVFDVAAFTNLSQDHLDFHGTMEDYFAAKASLFTPERARCGVVLADDESGRRLAAEAAVPLTTVHRAEATDVCLEAGATAFTWRGRRVRTALSGLLNVDNALMALTVATVLGVEEDVAAAAIATSPAVPGRLELVSAGRPTPFTVLVDYAHTPAALSAVLAEARRLATPGARVIVVFGAGGDRDRKKRPLMGAAAAAGADVVVVTSDNPRHEDPAAIIAEVQAGIPALGAEVVPDRRQAIGLALDLAGAGDVVVVAGKGHETYQEVGEERLPFDDR